MLKALQELRRAVKPQANGTQKALFLLAEVALDHEKRLCLLECTIGRESRAAMRSMGGRRDKPPKNKDGTEKVWGEIGRTQRDSVPVMGWK